MTFKKTISTLSFVLAASVSSIALAQGLGIAANGQVGVGSAPAAANLQAGAGGQANLGTQSGVNANAGTNNHSQIGIGSDAKGSVGSSLGGMTQTLESTGKAAVGTGRDTAAAARADVDATSHQAAKIKNSAEAKTSAKAKADLGASTSVKTQKSN